MRDLHQRNFMISNKNKQNLNKISNIILLWSRSSIIYSFSHILILNQKIVLDMKQICKLFQINDEHQRNITKVAFEIIYGLNSFLFYISIKVGEQGNDLYLNFINIAAAVV